MRLPSQFLRAYIVLRYLRISLAFNEECGEILNDLKIGDEGSIESPNYPSDYFPNLKCEWWLESLPRTKLRLTCNTFISEECQAGFKDYLIVSPDWKWSEYYLLCGNYTKYVPFEVESYDNRLSAHFRSSRDKQYKGFSCRYQVVRDEIQMIEDSQTFNGEENCGQASANRIVGGKEAEIGEFPWMVGLSFDSTWFCGGTLLNKRWVLTAAHCTYTAKSAVVFLGGHNLYIYDPEIVTQKTNEFYEHPEYDHRIIKNDIALVRLPNAVEYTDRIQPVCLPLKEDAYHLMEGKGMIASGWGKTSDDSALSPVLNKVNVEIVSNNECRKSYGRTLVRKTNICASGTTLRGGTCKGDSGSSLQYKSQDGRWIQMGIVSYGASTGCQSGYPNGYSKIASYLDFISLTTNYTYT